MSTTLFRRSLSLISASARRPTPSSPLRGRPWTLSPFVGRNYSGALLTRSLSFSAVPRTAFRALRSLGVAGGVGAGALAYANHKVDGVKQSISETWNTAAEWGSDAAKSAQAGMSGAWGSAAEAMNNGREGFSAWSQSFRDWMASERVSEQEQQEDNSSYPEFGESDGKPDPDGRRTAAALALSSGVTLLPPDDSQNESANDLMLLTKKLIEIRSILLSIDHAETLQLPSIVVVGSQSSGKSSVLESIVGHEFLPKGNNMVTRRPIELTLIHTPRTAKNPNPEEFAEFPQEPHSGAITDFAQVQRRLTDLNLAVPSEEAVSPVPIELRIHSPRVPDLSLVDLPGYVQLASMDQPDQLREKIQGLCEKYIRANNIILAVCAADVDLANSPALRASRKVDPLGMRTIGVITKMDLVDPAIGAGILANDRYPLALGYVGVICKAPGIQHEERQKLFNFGSHPNTDLMAPVQRHERSFFEGSSELFSQPGMLVGTNTLKRRLMTVLESAMSNSLTSISDAVAGEMEEASYQFKVQYNDRCISAESYVAETMDLLKAKLADMSKVYSKPHARSMLRQEVDMIVLDTLAGLYWGDQKLADLTRQAADTKRVPNAEALEPYWHHKLEASTSALTKSGIGRMSTNMFVQQLRERIEALASAEPFVFHPNTTQRIVALADSILQQRVALTSSQVENSVKPLKRDPEVDDRQWDDGRQASVKLLEEDLRQCQDTYNRISDVVGGRKLRRAMGYVRDLEEKERAKQSRLFNAKLEGKDLSTLEEEDEDPNRPAFNPNLLVKAREAMFLSNRAEVLKSRVSALNHKRCKLGPENSAFCPEAFLEAVAAQLTHTAIQHINMELLGEFFYQFPRQIDSRTDLDRDEMLRFARENPSVKRHLDLQDRKEKLELVREKLDSLVKLQEDKDDDGRGSRRGSRKGLFGLF